MKHHDWEKVNKLIFEGKPQRKEINNEFQIRKYQEIENTRQPHPPLDTKHTVVNLTYHMLTDDEISVLAKGVNYAIVPRKIPMGDIIASVEAAICTLP